MEEQQGQPEQYHQAPPRPAHEPTNAGVIILQWLTYAFWGWTILALSILTSTILASFIGDADTQGFTPYGIAAVLVLLPLSFVCDAFYLKKEPTRKTGAAMVIMVIHAVLFALFGIGSLIVAVVSMVTMFTSGSDTSASQVTLFSSLIVAAFYGLTFLRTLNPAKVPEIAKFYRYIMLGIVLVIVGLGFAGPIAKERQTRNDRLITSNIGDVQRGVEDYTAQNNKLPASLNDLQLNGDAEKLVSANLVEYKPEGVAMVNETTDTSTSRTRKNVAKARYRYQLCVTYKEAEKKNSGYSSYNQDDADGYSTYIDSFYHDRGPVCYKLETF
jgi:competence protein ComGC